MDWLIFFNVGEMDTPGGADAVEATASRGQRTEVGLSEFQGVTVGDRFN